jgi:hypothetical protein
MCVCNMYELTCFMYVGMYVWMYVCTITLGRPMNVIDIDRLFYSLQLWQHLILVMFKYINEINGYYDLATNLLLLRLVTYSKILDVAFCTLLCEVYQFKIPMKTC